MMPHFDFPGEKKKEKKKRDLILAELHFLLVRAVPTDCFRTSHKVLNRNLMTKDKPFFDIWCYFFFLHAKGFEFQKFVFFDWSR